MSEVVPQDNPIDRASIAQLTPDQLVEYIGALQQRRLKSYKIYEAGKRAKQDATDVKTAAQLEKVLSRMTKLFERVEADLEKLDQQAIEVQVYRLALGDLT